MILISGNSASLLISWLPKMPGKNLQKKAHIQIGKPTKHRSSETDIRNGHKGKSNIV